MKEVFDIPTGRMGLSWKLNDLLSLAKRSDDPALHPDVIYDLFANAVKYVKRQGYVIVYEQTGMASGRYTPFAFDRDESDPGPEETGLSRREEAIRSRIARRPEESSFWRGQTNMYQVIAVREELVQKTALISLEEAEERARKNQYAAPQFLRWDEARGRHLRYLGGD